jgi:hypothetical protein
MVPGAEDQQLGIFRLIGRGSSIALPLSGLNGQSASSPAVTDHSSSGHLLVRQSDEQVPTAAGPGLRQLPIEHASEVLFGRQFEASQYNDAPTGFEVSGTVPKVTFVSPGRSNFLEVRRVSVDRPDVADPAGWLLPVGLLGVGCRLGVILMLMLTLCPGGTFV